MASPVLLVHDDIAVIAALRRLFVRKGYEVLLATSAADASVAFGHYVPALIILAPMVEGGRGRMVLEELSLHPDRERARVLLLGEAIPGFEATVVPFPLDGAAFLETVEAAIQGTSEAGTWRSLAAPGQPEGDIPGGESGLDWGLSPAEAEEPEVPTPQAPIEEWDPFGATEHPPLPSPRIEVISDTLDEEVRRMEEEVRAEAARRRQQRESHKAVPPGQDDLSRAAAAFDQAVREETLEEAFDFGLGEQPEAAAPAGVEVPLTVEQRLFETLGQLEQERDIARQRAADLAEEAAAHERAAEEAERTVALLASRDEAAGRVAARAGYLAEVVRNEAALLVERRRQEAEATEAQARQESARREQEETEERARILQAERDERERLARELEEVRRAAERARLEAEEAQRQAVEERARREAEERARAEAEEEAERAREQARKMEARADLSLIGILRGENVRHIPRSGVVPLEKLAGLVLDLLVSGTQVRLELKVGDTVRVLWFHEGGVVGAVSSVPHESLLERARQDGLIDARQQAELRLLRAATASDLLAVMRERGHLREVEVVPLVQRHAEQIVLDALSEPESAYRLHEEELPPEVPKVRSVRPALLLLVESVRRGLDPRAVPALAGGLRGVPSRVADAPVAPEALELSGREKRFLRLMDGQATTEQLLLAAGLKQDEGLMLVAVARALGLIAVEVPAVAEPEPSAELDARRLEAKLEELQAADYFSALGLSRSAGRDEVQRAFELLTSEFHPLRYAAHSNPLLQRHAEQVHALLAEAAHALQDDHLRTLYARHLVD